VSIVESTDIALFLYSLDGGGAERVMLNLACNFAQRGLKVDLVLVQAKGPYLSQLPSEVRVVELKAARTQTSLWDLITYLRRERPSVLLSTMHYANEVALWAKALAWVPTKVLVCEQNTLSRYANNTSRSVERWTPLWAKLFYPWADGIITASRGVAQDLVKVTGLPVSRIQVIYNPVITPELAEQAKVSVNHPWFTEGEPPVILGVGRLVGQKDFPTLIRAFDQVQRSQSARLMILGSNAGSRPELEKLIQELGLEQSVAMPGFVDNPYSYMAKAGVFVLSSRWEGFGNVVAEALAVGTPVVSTDCESGPAEILAHGKYGELVPVGDPSAMAKAILKVLSGDVPSVDPTWLSQFSLDTIAQQYLSVMGITKPLDASSVQNQ
jgi:glycosyltransferase involved in cell wall biosynthesis